MNWQVEFYDDFLDEFETFEEEVQDSIFVRINLLSEFGFNLGRPYVDNLIGSKFPNMKELRFEAAQGVWRVAFAFDPERKAILLVAGNKRGKNQKRFYTDLIYTADNRFKNHLVLLKKGKKK